MLRKSAGLSIKYYAFLLLAGAVSHIPFELLYPLSDALYYPVYFIIRYRREIVRKNLTESFPDKSRREIMQIEKRFYHFLVDTALESCKLITISPEEIKRRMVFRNIEVINERLRQGRSISLLLGHYGNPEWVATVSAWLYKEAVPAQIYKKLSNEAADKIVKKLRERWGATCIDMHHTARYIAASATDYRPYIIGFIADQPPRKKESTHFILFLNHKVPVLTGPEKITKHFGYEAIFISVKRVKRGYYECVLSPLHDNPRALPDFELTSLYYRRLEQDIISHPELYLWTHKRFKDARTCLS